MILLCSKPSNSGACEIQQPIACTAHCLDIAPAHPGASGAFTRRCIDVSEVVQTVPSCCMLQANEVAVAKAVEAAVKAAEKRQSDEVARVVGAATTTLSKARTPS